MSIGAKARAYAELGRISNLPTCLTNVLAGCALGVAAQGSTDVPGLVGVTAFPWGIVGVTALAVSLLYASGMALNDAFDARFDREARAERPIPTGRVTLREAWFFGFACMALGVLILAPLGAAAVGFGVLLALTILAYDWLHKRFVGSVVLMGACRGLVYIVAASSVAWPLDWRVVGWPALAITLYTITLTLIARGEHVQRTQHARWTWILLAACVLPLAAVLRPEQWGWLFITGAVFLAWCARGSLMLLARPPRVKGAVMTWLSGFCLLDAYVLALLERPGLAMIALGLFVVTTLGHRRIQGT